MRRGSPTDRLVLPSPLMITRFVFVLLALVSLARAANADRVQTKISDGLLEGAVVADGRVHAFKGIPFAAPPVGELRWKAPQPVQPWNGVRPALEFGPRAMQGRIFSDMVFRDAGPSEDCLYLNVWAPAEAKGKKLPVMVWIYGGGFAAGASSEPRQDGTQLCQKGVVVVSMNYRLGVFGFLAHPELTAEAKHRSSGNYGLMDQIAALEWVKRNIAQFGGDPENVTIFGESAGSFSVSALVASPRARGLVHKAIGQSGAIFSRMNPQLPLAKAEEQGREFLQQAFGTATISELRTKSAAELLEGALKAPRRWFGAITDGYVLPASGEAIFSEGRQAHIPVMAGWTRDEGSAKAFFGEQEPTLSAFQQEAATRFGERAPAFLAAYQAKTDAEAKRAAADWAGDNFIGYSTWKFLELHRRTGNAPVYRYYFAQTLPADRPDAKPGDELVAPHASDIEYTFRVLDSRAAKWGDEHRRVSELMASYWTNFAKTGNPNASGLPHWPEYEEKTGWAVMHLQAESAAAPDAYRGRYLFLDAAPTQK